MTEDRSVSQDTIAIFNKIDASAKDTREEVAAMGQETRARVDRMGAGLRSELTNVTSEIANVRDRLGTLEGANRGQNIELRDLKLAQGKIERKQEKLSKSIDGKLKDHESAKHRKNSLMPKKAGFSPPRWLVILLTSIGILAGGASLAIVKSCESDNPRPAHSSGKVKKATP